MSIFGNHILLAEDQIGGSNLAAVDTEEQEDGPSQTNILKVLGNSDWFESRNSRFGKRSKSESYPKSLQRVQKSFPGVLRSLQRASKFLPAGVSIPNRTSKSHQDEFDLANEKVLHIQRNILNTLRTRDWLESRNSRFGKRANTESYQTGM